LFSIKGFKIFINLL